MSRRIRSLKPEILEDEKTATMTDAEFRVFISAIILSDDYGNFRAHAGFVHGAIYWAHGSVGVSHTETALKKLNDIGVLRFYHEGNQVYGHVVNWSKHQKVDKPGIPRVPKCPNDSAVLEFPGFIRETLATDQDQDMDMDQDMDQEPKGVSKDESEVTQAWETYIAMWSEFHTGKGGRPPVLSAGRRGHIRARLRESGASVVDQAIRGLFASDFHKGKNDDRRTFLAPEYIFRSVEQFEKCLGYATAGTRPKPAPPALMPNHSRDMGPK